MTTATLTHFKKLQNPDYIGAYALEPGKDLILTIKSCGLEMITGNGGKKEEAMVIHFKEAGTKPMICNVTNAKMIAKVHSTPYIEQWSGKRIQLYASRVSAFGETVDALRIRDFVPQSGEINVSPAIDQINNCSTLDELKQVFSGLPKEVAGHPDVIALKDSTKLKLSA